MIYGDTDSLFLLNDENVVRSVMDYMADKGFEVKVDKTYVKLLITESKKRYVGLLENGEVDIVGFEAVRGGIGVI